MGWRDDKAAGRRGVDFQRPEEEVLSGGGGASPAAREDLHQLQQEEDGQLRGLVQYMVQHLHKEMGQSRFDQGGGNHSRLYRTQ
jgi:hypothetical protein